MEMLQYVNVRRSAAAKQENPLPHFGVAAVGAGFLLKVV
jgi:hypothetical protein